MNFDREALQWSVETRSRDAWWPTDSKLTFSVALASANALARTGILVRLAYVGRGGRVFRSKPWSNCVVLETDDGNPELDEGAAE